MNQESQGGGRTSGRAGGWKRREGVPLGRTTPNPKLKLLEQVREVMRLKRYSIRTVCVSRSASIRL